MRSGKAGILASAWDLENVKGMRAGCPQVKDSWAPTLGDRKETAIFLEPTSTGAQTDLQWQQYLQVSMYRGQQG